MLCKSGYTEFDANHASLVVFIDHIIRSVRFELNPTPLSFKIYEVAEGAPPERDWFVIFI